MNTSTFFVSAACFTLLAAACGGNTVANAGATTSGSTSASTTTSTSSTSTSSSGQGTGGASAACHVDPPGTKFTFHVHNTGTSMRSLTYGCGGTIPVVLDTPAGMLSIGPGMVIPQCEFTCESFYKNGVQQGCSDCGPGVGATLAPGATVDITWDRRVYEAHTAAPSCVGGQMNVSCALAVSVAATAMQKGVLTVCSTVGPEGGVCAGTGIPVSFTADTTMTETTINVQ